MEKNLYKATATNSSTTTDVNPRDGGHTFTSIAHAEKSARAQFGSGWKITIIKVWIDGDGQSYNADYDTPVKTFTIR